jgi:CDP-paratose 2-epimerase
MKKILITGGAGFIGFNAAKHFKNMGLDVFVVDNLSRKGVEKNLNYIKKNKINFLKVDCKNSKKIINLISKIKPNFIFHLTGQVAVTKSFDDPIKDLQENVQTTINILEGIKYLKKKPILVFSSTNKIYGDIDDVSIRSRNLRYQFKNKNFLGINENKKINLISPYGCSKGSAEYYIIDYAKNYNFKYFILRQSCIYGPNQYGHEDQGWISWIMTCALFNKKINIFGDGKQVRDALYIDDLIDLYETLIKKSSKLSSNIFNIGGGINNTLSILELINFLNLNLKNKINISFKKKRTGDQFIYVSDNSKVKKLTGWSPSVSISLGLNSLLNWLNEERIFFLKNIK